jgi:hypothetical protein
MEHRNPPSAGRDADLASFGNSRHYQSLVLRDSRCRFIVEFLRETRQRSPIHVSELVDQFLVGEMGDLSDEEIRAVRRELYHLFSHHCLVQLKACGLVTDDQYHDTVKLR